MLFEVVLKTCICIYVCNDNYLIVTKQTRVCLWMNDPIAEPINSNHQIFESDTKTLQSNPFTDIKIEPWDRGIYNINLSWYN